MMVHSLHVGGIVFSFGGKSKSTGKVHGVEVTCDSWRLVNGGGKAKIARTSFSFHS
jgi:hypothetical protein